MKIKVKVEDVTPQSLERIKQIQISKCKLFFTQCPFTTNLYMSMKTGISLDFIVKNKKEIYG